MSCQQSHWSMIISISEAPQPSSLYGSRSERLNLEIYKEKMSSSIRKYSNELYINTDSLACLISSRYLGLLNQNNKTILCFGEANTLCEKDKSTSDDS